MRGKSIIPVIIGKSKHIHEPTKYIAGEMAGGRWIRQGDYKAVFIAKPYGDERWRLYNIEKDPGATTDLSKLKPKLLEKFKEAWESYAKDVGVVK